MPKRLGAFLSSGSSSPLLALLCTVAVLIAFSNCHVAAQVSHVALNATQAELDCLSALSFELCNSDSTCPTRFYLDQYMEQTYKQSLFSYLLNIFILNGNLSVTWSLAQTLAIGDTFSQYVDATHGTSCSTDPTIQSLTSNNTASQAQVGRAWWLLVLRQVEFCTENQIFVQGMGCVCKEDKNCDETKTDQFTSVLKVMIVVMIVVFVITLSRTYVFTSQVQGLCKEFLVLMQVCSTIVHVLQNMFKDKNQSSSSLPTTEQPQTPPPAVNNNAAAAASVANTTSNNSTARPRKYQHKSKPQTTSTDLDYASTQYSPTLQQANAAQPASSSSILATHNVFQSLH